MPIGPILLPVLLACCFLYYIAFAADLSTYDGETGLFQLALNSHDHFVYVNGIDRIRDGDVLYELTNDVGIAAIYLFLVSVFPIFADPDFTLISLIFNCLTLVCCYFSYASICERLRLGTLGKLSFFANVYFIYFAQLINKDLLTVLAFLLAIQCALNKKLWPLLVMLPIFAMVRQQLVVFVLAYVFLMHSTRPGPRIAVLYVATSLAAGFLSVFASVIGSDSLGDGFSSFLVDFNQQYYVGYLLFNPLRVIQYFADSFASFSFITETGGIDTAKFLRIPQLVVVLLLLKPMASVVTRFGHWLETPARSLVLVVVAYLLAWLMNPTVNARYTMLITPVLVLFGLYVRAHTRRSLR